MILAFSKVGHWIVFAKKYGHLMSKHILKSQIPISFKILRVVQMVVINTARILQYNSASVCVL
jgi:hypothetical protein